MNKTLRELMYAAQRQQSIRQMAIAKMGADAAQKRYDAIHRKRGEGDGLGQKAEGEKT